MGECSCLQIEFRCPKCGDKYFGSGSTKEEALLDASTFRGYKYRYAGRSKIGLERYYPPGSLFASGWNDWDASISLFGVPPGYLGCKCGFASNNYDDFVP